jgi:hypothetical protein
MNERLETIKENIKICEDIQKTDPGYYEEHWAFLHSVLLEAEEEFEALED